MKQIIEFIVKHYAEIIAGTLSIYEVIARLIPTVNDHTILGRAIKVLAAISEFLNIKRK